MKRKAITMLTTFMLAASMSMTSFAGTWEQAGNEWKYKNDDGTYATSWQWIDGKSYYFDGNGNMAKATTVDGYTLNADGQWVVDGVVQTQGTATQTGTVNHSANYDPAHPLAGKIDEWNLRLPYQYIGPDYICNQNVQALLTGQMAQYYMPPAGDSVNPTTGTHMYVSQEDYDLNVKNTQALYQWFSNWLNSMDFETMSEMDKAKAIQNVLSEGTNVILTGNQIANRYADYAVLIEKNGNCTEYAMTAMSLAKALGLKATVYGTGDHAVYYIQVDGKAYFGQNNQLNLNSPTPDTVFFQ